MARLVQLRGEQRLNQLLALDESLLLLPSIRFSMSSYDGSGSVPISSRARHCPRRICDLETRCDQTKYSAYLGGLNLALGTRSLIALSSSIGLATHSF
jgi:hypothetical protein